MGRKDSSTRMHILMKAATIVERKGGESLHISDVAKEANVGVPTIYYHFESKTHLIAEAQLSNYLRLAEPLHNYLTGAEFSLTSGQESGFWNAIEENLILAWSVGQPGDSNKVLQIFLDIGSDQRTQESFTKHLDVQFARWIRLIEGAKNREWIHEDFDAKTITNFFWSASVGQAITFHSSHMKLSSDEIRHFVRRFRCGVPPEAIERNRQS